MSNIELEELNVSVIENMKHGRNISLNVSKNSLNTYLVTAKQYNEFINARKMKVNEDSIIAFFKANKHWSPNTFNLKRQALIKTIQNQPGIKGKDLLTASVRDLFNRTISRVKYINQAVQEDKYLTRKQVEQLIKYAKKRIALIIEFAFMTGCRVSEMVNIKQVNVHFVKNKCHIEIIGKGSKYGKVFIERELYDRINAEFDGIIYLFENSNHNPYGRKYIWSEISKLGKKFDLRLYPHIFRHSCAMDMKTMNYEFDTIQKFLRHSDPATTLKFYYHNDPTDEIAEKRAFKKR